MFGEYNSVELPQKEVWEYNSAKLPQREMFWEYNSAELPHMKCFEKIQLREVVSKEMFWEYNSVKLPQRKYFENIILQNCLKGNVLRIQFRRIALKSYVGIQLCRVASKKMFWEYNSAELP